MLELESVVSGALSISLDAEFQEPEDDCSIGVKVNHVSSILLCQVFNRQGQICTPLLGLGMVGNMMKHCSSNSNVL